MHVVYEYCSDEPFYPVPKFTAQPKSSQLFYNWITERNENWFGKDSKLGEDFSTYRGTAGGARGMYRLGSLEVAASRDLDAMVALCEIRTNDFINLESRLEELMTANYQPEVYQI